jgi:iron(III) transport system substrate-binding protein
MPALFTRQRGPRSRLPSRIASMLSGLALAASAVSPVQAQSGSAAMDDLVKAARAEGSLTMYVVFTDNVVQPFIKLFNERYGVRVDYVRLSGGPLTQRYSTELEAGNPAADMVFFNNAENFLQDGVKKGWLTPVTDLALPALREFPARFVRSGGAIVQISPWHILYNTEKLKGADIPKGWQDLLDPKYKGQIMIADLAESDSYLDVWAMLHDTYGEKFFAGLRAQNIRWASGVMQAVQALGAGEASIQVPATRFVGQIIADKGGPVSAVLPNPATGIETYMVFTNRAKAKHPNAARLFANFILTPEGNKTFAAGAGAGTFSVFDTTGLPKAYASPKLGTVARKAELRKLLGLQP